MTTMRRLAIAAVATTMALAATGCGTGTDAQDQPGQALENRFARGTVVEMRVEGDSGAVDDQEIADQLATLQDVQRDAPLVAVGVDPDGQPTSLSMAGAVDVRWVTNDLYLRADMDRLDELVATEDQDTTQMPDPQDLADQLSLLIGGHEELTTAFANGEWVGVTGVTDAVQGLLGDLDQLGSMGMPSAAATPPGDSTAPADAVPSVDSTSDTTTGLAGVDEEELQALREEYDLTGFDAFLATYATVEGDGPWEVTIDGAALREALAAIEEQAGVAASDMGMGTMGADLERLPDTIEGITITADGDLATSVRIDMSQALADVGDGFSPEERDAMQQAGATIVFDFTDWDETAGAPEDAVTIPMNELLAPMGG